MCALLRLVIVTRLAVLLALPALLVGCAASGPDQVSADAVPTAASSSATTTPVPARTGPLGEDGSAASCSESYDIKSIGNRAFAFDGTIVSIGEGGTNKADKGQLGTAAVTFLVNEWFEGGAGDTVTVDLMAPTSDIAGGDTPAYQEGTRLLVSGEPRWGGAPLDDAIAWSCGGFTRYYEPAVADDWRTGTT